ncbi:MAG: sulfotransferase [Sphingomicrobium sp.]
MAALPPLAREAIALARSGDFGAALELAREALGANPDDMGLQMFVGLLHTRRMELDVALPYFRAAHALAPRDAAARLELARVLIALGELDEAEAHLNAGPLPDREARKLRAGLLTSRGEFTGARDIFRQLVKDDSNDFEAWSNFGAALLTTGAATDAADALATSLQLNSQRPKVWEKWADAHRAAGTAERATEELKANIAERPGEVVLLVTLARLEDLLGRPNEAVTTLERALQLDRTHPETIVALAELSERQNQLDRFEQLIGMLEEGAPNSDKLPLLRAQLAFRRRDFDIALGLVEAAPTFVLPGTRARLIGEIEDRRQHSDRAWAAFSTMNLEDRRAFPNAAAEADAYRGALESDLDGLTPTWAETWRAVPSVAERPAFLIGFPRSGTTLLDTFLMGHEAVVVSEENPLLEGVSKKAGAVRGLARMAAPVVEELRAFYFELADQYIPGRAGRLLLDKLPFALIAGPYIHRLFAGAPIIFVERHPCDVVLSCFFTRFHPAGPAAHFLDLEQTARLYDTMMRYWSRCRQLLPLNVHSVRYERLVADAPRELRAVADFLGLEWSDKLSEHHVSAHTRGFIRTPSYAQVIEPVYSRSVARWTRYRDQLQPVLPILAPWIAAFGYES